MAATRSGSSTEPMTILKKPVRRETEIAADHHGRHIIIELDPGPPCVTRFREKGRANRLALFPGRQGRCGAEDEGKEEGKGSKAEGKTGVAVKEIDHG
jgi:hypothetical protein